MSISRQLCFCPVLHQKAEKRVLSAILHTRGHGTYSDSFQENIPTWSLSSREVVLELWVDLTNIVLEFAF